MRAVHPSATAAGLADVVVRGRHRTTLPRRRWVVTRWRRRSPSKRVGGIAFRAVANTKRAGESYGALLYDRLLFTKHISTFRPCLDLTNEDSSKFANRRSPYLAA
ncbi:hypothetical protein EVAR_90385_1 [Eumeta japonica]|uniref:Uncharacterized protein n=1 Tax=Eumeta variegata TaxID=151549 RepID=A0A4C1ZV32_EUMVA|nr:hypothetical protein EVAR_90385_1 [Eumeta japonica]